MNRGIFPRRFIHSFALSGPSWENTPSVFNPFTVSFAAFFLVNISRRGIIDYRGDIHELHEIHVQIMFIHGAWLADP